DGERVAYLVRDRGGELAERGELLVLREPRPRRAERVGLRVDDRGVVALAPPPVDHPADEPAEERVRRPAEAGGEEGHVAAVQLEADAQPEEGHDVEGGEQDAARRAPPARLPESRCVLLGHDRLSKLETAILPQARPPKQAARAWRPRHTRCG